MGMGTSEDMATGNGNVNGTSPDLNNQAGIGPGFYMPPSNGRNNGFGGDDDWNYA